MHCEAKQMETLEFGAEKGLLQGRARRMGCLCSKTLNSMVVLGEKFLIGKIRGEGCRVCDFLLIGWREHRAVFPESCAQPEVTILHLGRGLSLCWRTGIYCYVYSLWRNQDPAPGLHCCFSAAPPLSLHPLPSLISNCLNLPFRTSWA